MASASRAALTFSTSFNGLAGGMAGPVDAHEPGISTVLVEHAAVGTDLEIFAETIGATLTDGAQSFGVTDHVALIVDTGAITTLDVEDADRGHVGASAADAEMAVVALAVIDASALAVRARPLVRNADPSVVTGETGAVD